MKPSLLDQPLGTYLDQLASDQPAPGGGSAAAVTGSLAAGLVAMAARFSSGQLPDAADRAGRADAYRADLVAMAERDAEAYGAVLEAFRLPAEPDPQQRRRKITDALEHAALVPLEITEVAARTAAEAAELAEQGNPNLRGDALTAVILAWAAARSAAELVRLNVELGALERDLLDRARLAVARAGEAADSLSPEEAPDGSAAGPSDGPAAGAQP
ncbi:MAG: formiminotransferase-cyclodeaminase [Pseudonocardiaceae bacterium]|nr:formiminotransferase-cyclodeaminase [Pseudonocardiaceae bacterium]